MTKSAGDDQDDLAAAAALWAQLGDDGRLLVLRLVLRLHQLDVPGDDQDDSPEALSEP